MSLLINGMSMPSMCCLCPCHDWDMEDNRYYCQALKDEPKIIDENTRRDDCPLVEIPTPHGKLIDADAAIARLKHLYCDGCGCDCSTCPWGAFIKYIDGRPIIIDAEKSGNTP